MSRREPTYAKLLWRVHPDRRLDAFEGILLRCGTLVESSALWPTDQYPAKPILLEYAGNDHTGRGHNRSNSIHILWRFEPEREEWIEISRTLTVGAEWIEMLMPIALRELGGIRPPDPDTAARAAKRFFDQLDKELGELAERDRNLALHFIFEQLTARVTSADLHA